MFFFLASSRLFQISRYFVLLEDGSLVGFKNKPDINSVGDPLNNFTVNGCQIMSTDRPKPYTFIIRGLQLTTVIERMFNVDTESERSLLNESLNPLVYQPLNFQRRVGGSDKNDIRAPVVGMRRHRHGVGEHGGRPVREIFAAGHLER